MHIPRRYTAAGHDPFSSLKFTPRNSRIVNPDGSAVFEMKDVLAPEAWSQVAVDILAQKYFRKAGVANEFDSSADPAAIGNLRGQILAFTALGMDGFFTDQPDLGVAAVPVPASWSLVLLGLGAAAVVRHRGAGQRRARRAPGLV